MAKRKLKVEVTTDSITVPTGSIPEAIDTLQNELAYIEEPVNIRETILGIFWDGCHAFGKAMEAKFGWVHGVPDWGQPPAEKSIPSGVGTTTLVPWGKFKVPGVDGLIQTTFERDNMGRTQFVISATVKRKHEKKIRDLAQLTREILKSESLYRGKAVKVRFVNDDDEYIQMPEPQFLDVSKASLDSLILSKPVWDALNTSVFTPIRYPEACRKLGIPLKRGVLFEGMYGTGKTLAAHATARLCEESGASFTYVEHATELEDGIRFALTLGRGVLFGEDVDRVTSGGRSLGMDEILNIVDGIESKDSELIIILTTNNVGAINQAMIRPGRLDDVIKFLPPDEETVGRLIHYYSKGTLASDVDLTEVSKTLAGRIPAVIRECVERSKLSQIKFSHGDIENGLTITPEALLDAANSMSNQLQLLDAKTDDPTAYETLGKLIGIITGGTNLSGVPVTRYLNKQSA